MDITYKLNWKSGQIITSRCCWEAPVLSLFAQTETCAVFRCLLQVSKEGEGERVPLAQCAGVAVRVHALISPLSALLVLCCSLSARGHSQAALAFFECWNFQWKH